MKEQIITNEHQNKAKYLGKGKRTKEQIITNAPQDNVKYRRVSTGRLALATTSALSLACFTSAIGYVSYAANMGFGITTVLIGTLMTIARLFDGITDPLISMIIDKTNTKFGKIRLFMIIGWVIESLALLGLYNWFCDKGHSIILFSVIYFIYYIGYTFQNMATQLISPIITNDPKQRPKVGVFNTIYNYLIATMLGVFVSVILLPQHGNAYNPSLLASISVITVFLSGIFLILSCIGVSSVDKMENFIVSHKGNKSLGLKDMATFLKNNRALQCFVFSATSDKLATNIAGQAIIGTILYGIIIGSVATGAVLNMVSIIPALIFAVIGGRYVGKHGSAKSISFWSFVSIIVNTLLIAVLLISGKMPIRNNMIIFVLFISLVMLQNGLRVVVSTATSSMLADVVDYEAYRSGKYMPGTEIGRASCRERVYGLG